MVKKKILLKNHHRTNNKKKKKQTRAETARAVTTFATSLKTFVDDLCAESGTNDSEEESALKTSASKFVDIINNNNNNTRNPTERKASTGNDTAKSQANVQIGKAQQKHVEEATSILNSAADKKNEPNDDHPKKKPGKRTAAASQADGDHRAAQRDAVPGAGGCGRPRGAPGGRSEAEDQGGRHRRYRRYRHRYRRRYRRR